MKTQSRHFPHHTRWLPKPMGSGAYRHWLVDSGSLTARLQFRCRIFSVDRVRLEWGAPPRDEMQLLGMRSHERALLREVSLNCDGRPVVFAHSVLPRRSLRGPWQPLGKLGNKPLGAALFANPAVSRTPLNFRKLTPGHPLYLRAASLLETKPRCFWARRSVFMLECAAILVTEVFLPGVLELPR